MFLSLQVREAVRFTAETPECLRYAKFHAGLHERVDVRTNTVGTILSEPKFLGCIDYQIFLPMVLRYARFVRARAPLRYL